MTPNQSALLINLIILHFVGDWLLQPDWMGTTKATNWKMRSIHVLIYTLIIAFSGISWPWLLWISTTHWVIDTYIPLYWITKLRRDRWGESLEKFKQAFSTPHGFVVLVTLDQLLHILTLLVAVKISY